MIVPDPLCVLNMFRAGQDTLDIAEKLGWSEAEVYRLLDSGRDMDWVRRRQCEFNFGADHAHD